MSAFKLLSLALILLISAGCVMSKIEEPKFEIVRNYGEFELRRYEPTVVAETLVTGMFADSANVGFRRLANYIFGGNKSKTKMEMTAPVSSSPGTAPAEKISMTAPVSQVGAGADQWLIAFTMPSKYTINTLPEPLDPLVTLREIPAATFAVIQFSGFNSASLVAEKTAELRSLAAKEKISLSERAVYARYNPPWTPWFLRRNEVLIEAK